MERSYRGQQVAMTVCSINLFFFKHHGESHTRPLATSLPDHSAKGGLMVSPLRADNSAQRDSTDHGPNPK